MSPLYHQNVPRTKKNLATTLGSLATSYMKGKQLGRQEAQKDVQNIMKNPQLAQYVDKDKLQKKIKRGYGGSSVTGSALSNALQEGATLGGQEPITKTIGDTLYQFDRNKRKWEQVAQGEEQLKPTDYKRQYNLAADMAKGANNLSLGEPTVEQVNEFIPIARKVLAGEKITVDDIPEIGKKKNKKEPKEGILDFIKGLFVGEEKPQEKLKKPDYVPQDEWDNSTKEQKKEFLRALGEL